MLSLREDGREDGELGAGIILLRVMFTGPALLSPVLLLDNLPLIDTLILY